ncbi:hypothetical protein KIW84_040342 [Lathyrus oleraceus]|uniref:Ubiquitin-like protease family profile domain-containing protein n=1 Tax=Pisum sativum TaxID=3888 RepID=A0A9D4X718_PEA|nr:hypothetical protein KIW84_040342 [Pisum sativum]
MMASNEDHPHGDETVGGAEREIKRGITETLSQSIVPYEDTDCRSILSRALDVPEYSGRVRGKGFGITQKSLNIKKQKTPSNKELQQTLEALKAEVLELRKERERDRAAGFKDTSDKEDFDQILYHTQLSVGVINTYMRYLYDKLMGPRGLEQRFSFLNPMKTNLTEMIRKPDEVRTYVVERFMADTDREKLFFLPFNTGDSGHWLLTTYPAMKTIVDTIIKTVRAQRKIQVPKRKANNITWNRVECPRQRNNIDCGYYTLRFMKETLLMDRTDIPSDYFDEYRCAYYSKDQLDEIKEELCQFIIELQVL